MATVNVTDPIAYRESIRYSRDMTHRRSRLISKASFLSKTGDSISSAETDRPSRVYTIVGTKKYLPRFKMPMQKYPTGSRYIGQFNKLGFSGNGTYRYPHGVRYEGTFNDSGEFHGVGTLIYPNNQKLEGLWINGILQKGYSFIYKCGEVMDENLKYCTPMDRRFHIEIQNDFAPAEQEYITPNSRAKLLPPGCYDVEYGTYDPQNQVVIEKVPKKTRHVTFSNPKNEELELDAENDLMLATNYVPPTKFELYDEECVTEMPSKYKQNLIQKYCRSATEKPVGYNENLYPIWMGGRKYEVFQTLKQELAQEYYYTPITESAVDLGISTPISFIQRPHKPLETAKRTRAMNEKPLQPSSAAM